jgi:hypothetical protein
MQQCFCLGRSSRREPMAAQENPFAFTGALVNSAFIVYEMTSK